MQPIIPSFQLMIDVLGPKYTNAIKELNDRVENVRKNLTLDPRWSLEPPACRDIKNRFIEVIDLQEMLVLLLAGDLNPQLGSTVEQFEQIKQREQDLLSFTQSSFNHHSLFLFDLLKVQKPMYSCQEYVGDLIKKSEKLRKTSLFNICLFFIRSKVLKAPHIEQPQWGSFVSGKSYAKALNSYTWRFTSNVSIKDGQIIAIFFTQMSPEAPCPKHIQVLTRGYETEVLKRTPYFQNGQKLSVWSRDQLKGTTPSEQEKLIGANLLFFTPKNSEELTAALEGLLQLDPHVEGIINFYKENINPQTLNIQKELNYDNESIW